MHAAGYVHGNIKPSNILWLPRQAVWTTVDFAYACHAGSEGPAVVRTLGYAAPETVAAVQTRQSSQMDTAIDAWAVGVVAFELLYGGPALEVEGEGRAQVRSHSLLPNSRRCAACGCSKSCSSLVFLPQRSGKSVFLISCPRCSGCHTPTVYGTHMPYTWHVFSFSFLWGPLCLVRPGPSTLDLVPGGQEWLTPCPCVVSHSWWLPAIP
jgi:serine/threonine protein kinase